MGNLQTIFEPNPQTAMGFAIPPEQALQFPLSLAERYQPKRIEDFIGIPRPKQMLTSLLAAPRPCSMLFIGPPGAGKTSIGMAFCEQLGGSLKHLAAQKCDVSTLDALRDQLAYAPSGGWWVVLIDEADGMTDKAQLQLLSRLDGTSALKPKFGGGMVRGTADPVIYIFTCNGRGPREVEPPFTLLPRFQSRNMIVEFEASTRTDLAAFLERVWSMESGPSVPEGYFDYMAKGAGIRDALMRLETDLLSGPRHPIPDPPEPEAPRAVSGAPIGRLPATDLATTRHSAACKAWETRRKRNRGQ